MKTDLIIVKKKFKQKKYGREKGKILKSKNLKILEVPQTSKKLSKIP